MGCESLHVVHGLLRVSHAAPACGTGFVRRQLANPSDGRLIRAGRPPGIVVLYLGSQQSKM